MWDSSYWNELDLGVDTTVSYPCIEDPYTLL